MSKLLSSPASRCQSIKDITHLTDKKTFSVELCPVRSLDPAKLRQHEFSFCSVVWLRTKEKPVALAERLIAGGKKVLLHLPGRNLKRGQLLEILDEIKRAGVRNLLCLQGDPSQVQEKDDSKCDFPYAIDLVRFVKKTNGDHFCIGVAAYPESKSHDQDFTYLKAKIEAGADFVLTQATFSNEAFSIFREKYQHLGLQAPIVAGVYVISSHEELLKMASFCGIRIPKEIADFTSGNRNDSEALREFGLKMAAAFVGEFHETVAGFHVFTLNDLDLAAALRNKFAF